MCRASALACSVSLLWLVATSSLFGQEKSPPVLSTAPADLSAVDKALGEKATVGYHETALSAILWGLSKQHHVPIVIDRSALKAKGVDPDMPVSMTHFGVPLRWELDLLLKHRGLAWTVRDNSILITTREEANRILFTKVYPVEDLLTSAEGKGKRIDDPQALVDLVNSLLDPDGSRRIEGVSVRIVPMKQGRGLSVIHSRCVQDGTAELLAALRSAARPNEATRPGPMAASKIKAALAKPTDLEFVETPLQDVVDYLKDTHKIDIQFDDGALIAAKTNRDTVLSVNMRGVSLRAALTPMLRQLGLAFAVWDDVLLITTPDEVKAYPAARGYGVSDLVGSHNKIGKVQYDYGPLVEAVTSSLGDSRHHPERTIKPLSSGAFQLLVARATDGDQDAIAALLAEIRSVGQRTRGNRSAPRLTASSLPGEAAFQKALASTTCVEFVATPLQDVIDYLKDRHKIEIQLDTVALADVGLDSSIPITVNAHNVPLHTGLEKILSPFKLTWTIRDEVLWITTEDEAKDFLVTKVYAVDDLPKADLPTIDTTKDRGSCVRISSDEVAALVVTAPYAVQEQIAAELEDLRDEARGKSGHDVK
jgi:hypothetical protein